MSLTPHHTSNEQQTLKANPLLVQHILGHHSTQQYAEYLNKAGALVQGWLERHCLYQGGDAEAVSQAIQLTVTSDGMGLDNMLNKINTCYLPNCVSTAHSACLAHLHPPSLVIGQLAELFISASNQSMDSWNQSPVATSMEKQLIAWLCQQVQFWQGSGVFTSGGTQSNLMGLLLARNRFYANKGVDVQQSGVAGQPAGYILCSDQAHFSVEKNVNLLGLGSQHIIHIRTDGNGAMCPSALAQQIESVGHEHIMAVVATAGTTDTGAIDDLTPIAKLCQSSDTHPNIWLHVDAAWGGALLLSHDYRERLAGIELADSVTLDFHKHWFLPISCGAFLLKDQQHYDSIRHHSDYLNPIEDEHDNVPNLVTYSLQTTRRFDALKLWMSLETLGTDTYGRLIDACIDTARQVANYLSQLPNIVVLNEPAANGISSVLFYVTPPHHPWTDDELRRFNRHIANELLVRQIANLATSQFKGQFCLKFTFLNPTTNLDDIKTILQAVQTMRHVYATT